MEKKWAFRINGSKLKGKSNRNPILSHKLTVNKRIKGYISRMRMIDS